MRLGYRIIHYCYTVPFMARQKLGQHFLADLDWREQIARAIRVSPHSLAPLPREERVGVPESEETGGGIRPACPPRRASGKQVAATQGEIADGAFRSSGQAGPAPTTDSTAKDHPSLKEPNPASEGSCWIEVGAGHGEMTRLLLAAGGPVFAVELDEVLAAGLRRLAKEFPSLTVVAGDILKTDLAALASGRSIRVYGNLPYYITSPVLHHLFAFADQIEELDFVIQTEVAARLAAQPGTRDYGYLSVVTQFYTRPELVFEIPREAFNPSPEVNSALVTLRLPGERAKFALKDELRFLKFVKLCFAQKRKTLVNNLRAQAKPEKIRATLVSLGLRPDARAEQLTVSQLAELEAQLEIS